MCRQRTRDSPILPFGGVVYVFAGHNENQNERETLSGVPNILHPLCEPGVIEGSAAASEAAAGLPTGPAPAQQSQGVMHNSGQDGSHFIDKARVRKRRG